MSHSELVRTQTKANAIHSESETDFISTLTFRINDVADNRLQGMA